LTHILINLQKKPKIAKKQRKPQNFNFDIFFLYFFKTSNINVDSTRKISDCKIIALKVERVSNTFENLNSSEMMLKMLKIMQIYQKCKFWGFRCFFFQLKLFFLLELIGILLSMKNPFLFLFFSPQLLLFSFILRYVFFSFFFFLLNFFN